MDKKEILISIIIPVYNVESYVSDCLNSVLKQINDQIEVIIIDDGSSDRSKDICEDIVNSVQANVKICTQNNKGLSVTRNRGIDVSNGKYVMFLDADDELDSQAIVTLLQSIKEYPEVDLFYYDAKIVDEICDGKRKSIYDRKNKVPALNIMDSWEYFNEYYVDTLIVSACLCLIKKKIIDNNEIRFDVGRLYEDNVFSLNVLLNSKKVCYLPYDLYIRRYRENSITTSYILKKNIQDGCFIIKRFLKFNDWILMNNSETTCNTYLNLIYKMYSWIKNMMAEVNFFCGSTNQIAEEIIDILNGWPERFKSFSYYLVLYLIVKENSNLCIDIELIHKKINECYLVVLNKISEVSSKRVALYGRGKHTEYLLKKYKELFGRELDFTVYVDTYQSEGFEDDGKRIVNIADVQNFAEIIIISSYEYRLEMKKKCYECNSSIEIIDLYDVEKMNMFDERIIFR